MTTGLSGSYAMNGTNLSLQPTEGKWNTPDQYGFDGGGHPILSSFRTFELSWGLISTSDLAQLNNFFNSVSNTGTIAVDIPEWGASQYKFRRYSGTVLSPLEVGAYFQEYVQDVRLLILRIQV